MSMDDFSGILNPLINKAPDPFISASPEQERWVWESADHIVRQTEDMDDLVSLEAATIHEFKNTPLSVKLAAKIARSKGILESLKKPLHLTVVLALYGEHERILSPLEHPLGEDFLRRKFSQLTRLFAKTPQHSWNLILVDDGCPHGSGKLAQKIIDFEDMAEKRVEVLFLETAIRTQIPVTRPLTSTAESQKGGAILYGMWYATQHNVQKKNHVILYTDADLSSHLGQSGLLVDSIVNGGWDGAIGSRRDPLSVVIKTGKRNQRGKLFIYLWKRLLPQLHYLIDTQCGFKAYRGGMVADLLKKCIVHGFSFDIELLLKAELRRPNCLKTVAIAWIDSEAASTTTLLSPYLSMLKSVVRLYREYLPVNDQSEPFAQFIEHLNNSEWDILSSQVPLQLSRREPWEFHLYDKVKPKDLLETIQMDGVGP